MPESFLDDIHVIAREYVSGRFPRASERERQKIIADWANKVARARGIVEDFRIRIRDPKNLRVLDVGSGNGGVSIAFAEAGAEVSGVDIEEDLVAIAVRHAAAYGVSPSFFFYDGSALPFSDRYFDAALSISVFEHVRDPREYLSEIWRVLKPGGVLYLALPNRLWPKETHTGLWGLAYFPRIFQDVYVRICGKNPLKDNNLHFYTYWRVLKFARESALKGQPWEIRRELGRTHNPFKRVIKAGMRVLGLPHRALLPHIMLLLEKPYETV